MKKRSSVAAPPESPSSLREHRAEKRRLLRELELERKRVQELEAKLNIMQDDDQYISLEDFGRNVYQDEWNQAGVSQAVHFTSKASFSCPSVDEDHSHASMPGVHGTVAMEKGLYSQPIWCHGKGYTLVGLVGSDQEKNSLSPGVEDFQNVPLMTMMVGFGDVVTLHVDMVNRRAEVYCGDNHSPGERIDPCRIIEDLPEKVWAAVAIKRNTPVTAVLLPCTHWDIREIEA